MAGPDLVLMGRASGAFGLRGELRIFSFAQDDEVFARAETIFAGPDPAQARPLTVVSCRSRGKRLLLTTRELQSREEAQGLGGAWIYLPRTALPPPGEGEFYWFDLQGALVSTAGGVVLGRVKSLVDVGPYELLVVAGDQGREAMIPLTRQMVPVLDPEGGRVVVDPPQGLLESQGWPEP